MSFPAQRPRRLRSTPAMRRLVAEHRVHRSDLILPLFVKEVLNEPQPIASMPGVVQHSSDSLRRAAADAAAAGLGGVMLFGIPARRDPRGSGSVDENGILNRSIREVRAEVGDELVVMSDLCLDEFTDHGHCGVLDGQGRVDNDATLEIYAEMAVAQASAGAHLLGPSGMMDGQVAVVRQALDEAGFQDAGVLRRVAMLLLVGILVVALGSSISVRPVEPIGPDQGELARIAAEKDSNTLLAQAKQLSAAPAPAADPALKYAIKTLTAATAALARPESSGASAASGPEATPAADGVPPTDLPGLIAGLARAAAGNLGAARSVEPGIARLLAAAGTGQALASQYLAQVTGLLAASIANPATASAPATACAGTLAPLAPEATTAPSTQSALAAVALAEQKSAYAYQLVAARIPSADSSRLAMKLLTSHRTALDAAEEQLRSHCTQPPIREPAFVLDPAFSTQPGTALAMVEDQLSLAYGDLIGLSDGPLRDWAINQLLSTGQNLMLWSPPSRALPGMPE